MYSPFEHFEGKSRIILTKLEKALGKMLYPFMLNLLNKLGIEGDFFNQIKRIYTHTQNHGKCYI